MPKDVRERFESKKREFLKLEDIKVGAGPIVTWNRRIEADLEVRSIDGTLLFQGPVFYYEGFATMPDTSVYDERALTILQQGIRLGLNGMAVGGKRRMIVDAALVCKGPGSYCHLVGPGNFNPGTEIHGQTLLVEATLMKACIPTRMKMFIGNFAWTGEVICWDQDMPKRDPADPIWRFY